MIIKFRNTCIAPFVYQASLEFSYSKVNWLFKEIVYFALKPHSGNTLDSNDNK